MRFTIQQMVDLNAKGKEMTLAENEYLQKCINILKIYATNILVREHIAKKCIDEDAFIRNDVLNGKITEYCITPTQEQTNFIQTILPLYILNNMPSIIKVLGIYKLDLQMEFIDLFSC